MSIKLGVILALFMTLMCRCLNTKKKAPLYSTRFIIGIIEHMDLFTMVLVSRPTFLIESLSAR